MAYNFSSGQFNKETTPRRLGNWEVPRWSPTRARPLEMRPDPKPICDINGHFLPGAPRGTSRCFGHYKGTWEMPRKISRQVAEELAKEPPQGRFPDWLNLRVQRPKAAAAAVARLRKKSKGKKEEQQKEEPAFHDLESKQDQEIENSGIQGQDFTEKENDPEVREDPVGFYEDKLPVDADGNGPYIPGSLTEPEKRHEGYQTLVEDAVESLHGPQENKTDKFWRKVAESAKHNELSDDTMKVKKSQTPKLPRVTVSRNFEFAKKMHVTNLEHQPLPDTLGYRNLSKIAEHRDSDIIVKPYAIGWKGFGASGPTCCTKMRVHRPKTCDTQKNDSDKIDQKLRPSTSAVDLGGQSKKTMSLMDLAICWDFKPHDSKWEPKPPKHIDGSNGSKAPAVFTMVHTPKDDLDAPIQSHANPIFNENRTGEDIGRHGVPYFEKDMTKERRKNSCEVQHCPQHTYGNEKSAKSSRRSSAQLARSTCDGVKGCDTPLDTSTQLKNESMRPDKLQPIKDAWSTNVKNSSDRHNKQTRNSLESYEKTPLAQGKLHQSSPSESQRSRRSTKDSDSTNNNNHRNKNCLSCNGAKIPQETKQREDYKFAFKAGNPNSVQSVSSTTGSKEVKIPKMRNPYSKKSYTIPTLAPPFSIWRDSNSSGYPEHWRLASVYQQAYKPPEQRRKPLIESVYQ